jgi:hypothetical protein
MARAVLHNRWKAREIAPGRVGAVTLIRIALGVPGTCPPIGHQTAVFEPVGVSGLIYWYVLLPVHAVIFGGMLREIARRAQGGRE